MRKAWKVALCVFAGFLALTLILLFCLVFAVDGPSAKDWDIYFQNKSVPEASEELRAAFDWQDYEKYDAPWQIDAVPTSCIMWSDSAVLFLNGGTDFILSVQYDSWNNHFDETYYVKRDFCCPTIAQAKLYCCPTQSSDTGFAPALTEEETEQIRYTVFNELGKWRRDGEPLQVWDLTESDWVYEKGEPKVIPLQWRVEGDVPLYQQGGCLLTDSQGNLYLTESPYHINDIGWRTRDLYPLSPQIQATLQKAIAENDI